MSLQLERAGARVSLVWMTSDVSRSAFDGFRYALRPVLARPSVSGFPF